MANFYFKGLSERGIYEQWQRHIDQANIINNIRDITKKQTSEYTKAIKESTAEQVGIMNASTNAICGTLSEGFGMIDHHLKDITRGVHEINKSIESLTSLLDWHLQTITLELKYNNLLSQNIALLLREPDSEKVRRKNIERGLKFYNDAFKNSFFFDDALLFFTKAIEENHTDYIVLHKLGCIYLYSKTHLNFDESIRHFSLATTYSEVDTNTDSVRLANILAGDVTKPLNRQIPTIDGLKYITGESYMQISIVYYIQGKFQDSIKNAEKAFSIAPELLEAGFILSKSLAASNLNIEAAKILKPIIQKDKNYSIKTVLDRDLSPKPEILNILEELRGEERVKTANLLVKSNQLRKHSIQEWKIQESTLFNEFQGLITNIEMAEKDIKNDNYLSYLQAQERLNLFISLLQNSILNRRKNELASQIESKIENVQYFLSYDRKDNNSIKINEYLEVNTLKRKLIKNQLNEIIISYKPSSSNFETFKNYRKRLNTMQYEIDIIQERGETKLKNLQFLKFLKVLFRIIIVIIFFLLGYFFISGYFDWMSYNGWRYFTLLLSIPFIFAFFVGFISSATEDKWDFLDRFTKNLLLRD